MNELKFVSGTNVGTYVNEVFGNRCIVLIYSLLPPKTT